MNAKPATRPTLRQNLRAMRDELKKAQNLYVAQQLAGRDFKECPMELYELRRLVETASKHVDIDADGIPTVYGSPLVSRY